VQSGVLERLKAIEGVLSVRYLPQSFPIQV
jgi:hypothetical protein